MTNPLLQPDDRFRRKTVLDEQGRNLFSDSEANTNDENIAADPHSALAAPRDSGPTAYQPQYIQSLGHRGPFIANLGTVSFACMWLLLLVFTDYLFLGVAAAFLGITLAIATLLLGYHDLRGMTLGAVDPAGRSKTLLGFRLALSGLILGMGGVLAVLWLLVIGFVEL